MSHGPVVIVGMPCAGKTTLGRTLGRLVPGLTHVSVGDLVRADRAENGDAWEPAVRRAYDGRQTFSAVYLYRLLQAADLPLVDAVIDGGPPLDRVLAVAGVSPALTVVLEAPESTRAQRFTARARSGVRDDDHLPLFRDRSSRHARELPKTIAGLGGAGPLLRVVSTNDPQDAVRQVLSAVALLGVRPTAGAPPPVRRFTDLDSAARVALSTPGLPCQVASGVHPPPGPHPILVVKPGLQYGVDLLRAVDRLASRHGYALCDLVSYRGGDLTGVPEAHFDTHWLYSRYASTLLGPGHLGGHEALDRYGPGCLDGWSTWRPRRIGFGRWQCDPPARFGPGVSLVNGHLPSIMDSYGRPDAIVVAARLAPVSGRTADSWDALRRELLGATDPARAHPDTLRGMAYARRLPMRGTVSFANNGFHLSGGPLEAIRDDLVWFRGEVTSDALRLAVDAPLPGGSSAFTATEGMSWGPALLDRLRTVSTDLTLAEVP